jgi:hypothetical protein
MMTKASPAKINTPRGKLITLTPLRARRVEYDNLSTALTILESGRYIRFVGFAGAAVVAKVARGETPALDHQTCCPPLQKGFT